MKGSRTSTAGLAVAGVAVIVLGAYGVYMAHRLTGDPALLTNGFTMLCGVGTIAIAVAMWRRA